MPGTLTGQGHVLPPDGRLSEDLPVRFLPRVSALVGVTLLIASALWIPVRSPTSSRDGDASLLAIGKRWKVELSAAPWTVPATPDASLVAIGKRWNAQLPA